MRVSAIGIAAGILFILSTSVFAGTPLEIAGRTEYDSDSESGSIILEVEIPEGVYQDSASLEISLAGPKGTSVDQLVKPEADKLTGRFQVIIPFQSPRRRMEDGPVFVVNLSFQLCDDSGMCLLPENHHLELTWDP